MNVCMYIYIYTYIVRTLPPFLKGGLTLPKIPRKGGMEKLLKGREILRWRKDSVRKGECGKFSYLH